MNNVGATDRAAGAISSDDIAEQLTQIGLCCQSPERGPNRVPADPSPRSFLWAPTALSALPEDALNANGERARGTYAITDREQAMPFVIPPTKLVSDVDGCGTATTVPLNTATFLHRQHPGDRLVISQSSSSTYRGDRS